MVPKLQTDPHGGNIGGGGGVVRGWWWGGKHGLGCEELHDVLRILNSLLEVKKMLEASSEVD